MKAVHIAIRAFTIFAWAVLIPVSLHAAPTGENSMNVSPTALDLEPGAAGLLTVSNNGPQPINVQIEGFAWTQTEKGQQLSDTQRVVVSPPMTTVAAGDSQLIRVIALPGEKILPEETFRIVVSQLPTTEDKRNNQVQLLLQFSVPVFVSTLQPEAPQLQWSATRSGGKTTLTVRNDGRRYVRVTGAKLSQRSGKNITFAAEKITYLSPGMSQSVDLPAAVTEAETALHIEGTDARSKKTFAADLTVQQK